MQTYLGRTFPGTALAIRAFNAKQGLVPVAPGAFSPTRLPTVSIRSGPTAQERVAKASAVSAVAHAEWESQGRDHF